MLWIKSEPISRKEWLDLLSETAQNITKSKASKWNIISWKTLYLVLITTIFFVNYSKVYDAKLGLMGDNVSYLSLGKSLADGDGYRMNHLAKTSAEVSIPILYPFIISCFMEENAPIIDNVGVVKKINGFFFLGFLITAFLLFSKLGNNEHISFFVICLLLFNTHVIRYSFVSMSEMSFMFWTFLSLLFFTKIDFKHSPLKSGYFWLSMVFLLLSYHTRAIGLSLLGGYMVYFVLTKKWRHLGVLVVSFLLLIIPWHYYVFMNGDSLHLNQIMMIDPYHSELGQMSSIGDWSARIFENFVRYTSIEFYSAISGTNANYTNVGQAGTFNLLGFVSGVGIITVILLGMFSISRFKTLVFGFFLGSVVVVFCWPPAWYGTRFMIAFIPIAIFFFMLGVNKLGSIGYNKYKQTKGVKFPFAIHFSILTSVLLLTQMISGYSVLIDSAKNDYPVKYKNYFELAEWTNHNVPIDVVIACRKPGLFYVFANRKVSGFLHDVDVEKIYNRLVADSIDYVVLDGLGFASTSNYLHPVTEYYKGKFPMIHTVGIGGKPNNPMNSLLQFDDTKGYHGEYLNGQKHGEGRFDYWDGSYYIGNWQFNLKTGYGEFYWTDGRVFKGGWLNDKREGEGVLFIGKSFQYTGVWKKDMMQGEFVVKDFQKGIYYNAYFVNNEQVVE